MKVALDQGEIVLARYRLEEKLGEGGMGVVWSASHVVTHKVVALKILKVKTDENVWRFFREARIAGELRHPRLVDVSDLLRLPDGTPVMVMELLRGESLGALIARGALDPSRLATILADVADTLADVHARGVVHRDLKPENVFIEDAGTVKILDFGVAKLSQEQVTETIGGMTQTGSVVGTPAYMAPEQVFGEKDVDARADAWSFGAIAFEAFVGRRLVLAENFGQAFKAITMADIPRVRDLLPSCSPTIAELVDGLLVRDRTHRFVDLRAAALRLRAVASGVEVPTSVEARRPTRWVPAVGVSLAFAGGLGVAIASRQPVPHVALEHPDRIAMPARPTAQPLPIASPQLPVTPPTQGSARIDKRVPLGLSQVTSVSGGAGKVPVVPPGPDSQKGGINPESPYIPR